MDEKLKGLRILLVEDEFLVAMDIADMLAELGCQVLGPVGERARALDMAQSEDLDGAVLDVNLRGEPVTPVADALKRRGIPFVLSTGYGASGLPAEHATAPRLTKPFERADVAKILEELFA